MARPLIIGPEERQAIAELIAMAAASPTDARVAMTAAATDLAAYRDAMAMRTVMLPIGFIVTYTREFQPHAPPPGLCHHISIGLMDAPGRGPSPEAVEMILEAFAMPAMADSDKVWLEDIEPGRKAVNVLALVA